MYINFILISGVISLVALIFYVFRQVLFVFCFDTNLNLEFVIN